MGVGSQASALLFEGAMVTVSMAGSCYLGNFPMSLSSVGTSVWQQRARGAGRPYRPDDLSEGQSRASARVPGPVPGFRVDDIAAAVLAHETGCPNLMVGL